MPPPKKMSYSAQAIVCLAPDLKENAEAIDVTARTDDAQMRVETKGTTDVFVNAQRMIGPIGDRHHAEGDKYVFVADPRSTPDKPLPPRGILASWKTESKISMLRGTIGGKAFESASVPSLAIRE
jgi:hypothetical protein